MRFKDIELTNYRCFDYAKLSFSEQGPKTINIVEGENGAGKTELLFAFQWALYGFDFSKLQGKSRNTFSLNSNLYYELENTSYAQIITDLSFEKPKSTVTINLEADDTVYKITCTETFFLNKTSHKIKSQTYRTISYKNVKKESFTLSKIDNQISDYDKVINKLIPLKVLNGLLFDGEKMMELTSFSTTNKAIEGIIEEITSSANIDSMNKTYKDIRRKTNAALSQLNKKNGNFDIAQQIEKQSNLSDEIDNLEISLKEDNQELKNALDTLQFIEKKLDEYKDNNNNLIEIKSKEALIKTNKDFLRKYQKDMISTISLSGYLLLAQPLFDSVTDLLEASDIPKGLNSEAVQSLIDSKVCLCGEPLDDSKIAKLKALKEQLPPININSTIKESLNSLQSEKNETFDKIIKNRNDIKNIQSKLSKLEKEKQVLSNKIIINSDDSKLKEYVNNKQDLEHKIWTLQQNIALNDLKLKDDKKINSNLIKVINETNTKNNTINSLTQKKDFCDKAILLIEEWKENNKKNALSIINKKLLEAYKILSEDYSLGKRIIICQHDVHAQYQLVVYFQEILDQKMNDFKESGEYEELKNKNLSEEQIIEKAILSIPDANSQGQAEINTLSFVKAMMDYASAVKHEGLEITRNYPLLIDSPFGQLSGDNLNNIAQNLSKFAKQVILMVSSSRLEQVNQSIMPKSLIKYKLIKSTNNNATTAQLGGE